MKQPKTFLVIAQYGGRRYVVATPDRASDALDLVESMTRADQARPPAAGRARTRYTAYQAIIREESAQ